MNALNCKTKKDFPQPPSKHLYMTRTVKIKLLPTQQQKESLGKTQAVFNEACNWLSKKAFKTGEFRKNQLQKLAYHECRSVFPNFSSQLIIRAIDVVCMAYKLDKRKERRFKSRSAAVYDPRVLSFKEDRISIWTVDGRLDVPIKVWNQELFGRNHGQADLIQENGRWFLHLSVWSEDKPLSKTEGFLGVDMGVVNVAVTSDGTVYSSESIERKRRQYASHRQRLQLRGTKNAKRRIRKAGRKESRFRRDVNHRIAKEIVRTAKGTSRGIAVEDLNGINKRTTVGRSQRSRRMGWSFFQLRTFIDYKAAEALVPFVAVDPKDTSRRCSCCGHTEKGNRRIQSAFRCQS